MSAGLDRLLVILPCVGILKPAKVVSEATSGFLTC